MIQTPEQRKMAAIASMYGYKTGNLREGVIPVSEFSVGDGAIVLTLKGEPVMSGTIEDIRSEMSPALQIGQRWFEDKFYAFRRI